MAELVMDGPGGPNSDAGRIVLRVENGKAEFDVTDFATGHGFTVPLDFDTIYDLVRMLEDGTW